MKKIKLYENIDCAIRSDDVLIGVKNVELTPTRALKLIKELSDMACLTVSANRFYHIKKLQHKSEGLYTCYVRMGNISFLKISLLTIIESSVIEIIFDYE